MSLKKKFSFKNVHFLTSVASPKKFPKICNSSGVHMPEVAIVGRSNVGKSTLINHLFRNKKLAKVSSTPGKTQLINFFDINKQLLFADLPGYGFAKVPKKVQADWGTLIEAYLNNRPPLKLILMLMDIRRDPRKEDLELFEWIVTAKKSMILVLTKVDKVNSNEKSKNTKKILDAFTADNLHYLHYSSVKNIGRQELTRLIQEALSDELTEEETTL